MLLIYEINLTSPAETQGFSLLALVKDSVTIRFKYKGQEYTGELSKVMGAGNTVTYHLMVNNFYWGRLRQNNGQWIFDPTPKTEGLEVLAEWMGSKVAGL